MLYTTMTLTNMISATSDPTACCRNIGEQLGTHLVDRKIVLLWMCVPRMTECKGCPTLTLPGLNSHCFLRSKAGTSTPLGIKQSPLLKAMAFRGRWIPSKMVVNRPGPSSTDKGCTSKKI